MGGNNCCCRNENDNEIKSGTDSKGRAPGKYELLEI